MDRSARRQLARLSGDVGAAQDIPRSPDRAGAWRDDPARSGKNRLFISRRLEREAQILGLLQTSPRTEDELLREVYGDTVHPSVMWVAERTIQGHLIKLLDDGKIRQEEN